MSLSEDIFRVFKDATTTSFQFLVADFGFTLDSITIDDSMAFAEMITCDVKYRNPTTEINISYTWYEDLRGTPQVICGRLKSEDAGNRAVAESYNLDMLIAERCPAQAVVTLSKDPVEKVKRTLQTYASILADCARDELKGDFSIFPRLRKTLLDEVKGAVFLHSGVDTDELIEHLDGETF